MIERDDILAQRDGESDFDYHRRLVYGKLVDKTLADYDYSELSPLIYGKEYSCDVARRLLYGSCKTLQLLDAERDRYISKSSPDYVVNELDTKVAELQRERQRLYDQRREYNKLAYRDGRLDNLCEHITEAANKLNESVGDLFDFASPSSFENVGKEAVLVFGDWHYGMVTHNAFNTYNTEIAKARVAEVTEAAIKRIVLHECNKVHVVILGDLLHGAIHVGSRVASEELVCDQLMQASEILAQSILRINQFVPEVNVYTTYGNHGRTVQNKHDSVHRDNMERVVGWWLRERLKNEDTITVMPESDTEFISIDVCGHQVCAAHGDLDSVKGSPRLLATLFHKKYGKDIEYIILGDKHHRESFDELGVTASICGSLCGTDDYANEKRLFSDPSQMLLIFDAEDGVDAEYRLKCK